MNTRGARLDDLRDWVELRHSLWPKHTEADLSEEARDILRSDDDVCFLLVHPSRGTVGFVEACVYRSPRGPYCHVEGWYVIPEFLGQGYGKELIGCVEQWSLHRSIVLLTSDTEADYPLSPDAHARSGFKKTHELMIFVKELEPSPGTYSCEVARGLNGNAQE